MSVPEFQCYMAPLLELSSAGEVALKDAYKAMGDHFDLSDEQRAELVKSGMKPQLHDRVQWAITYLVQAKLLKRPRRGVFTIAERGQQILATNPERIDREYLMQFEEFVDFQTRRRPKKPQTATIQPKLTDSSDLTPEELIASAQNEISSQIQGELLERVLESSPAFFEKLIVNLLVAMGYGGSMQQAGEHLGKSGDEGIDGLINEDKLGLDVIYIQAKRYAPHVTVGRPDIQQFAGSLMGKGAQKGVFVTTSAFSSHALEYTKQVPQRIILIDGNQLTNFMIENNVGTRLESIVEIKKIDEDFFE